VIVVIVVQRRMCPTAATDGHEPSLDYDCCQRELRVSYLSRALACSILFESIRVDLFPPSTVADNAVIAHELYRFLTLQETGDLLSLSKRQVQRAKKLGKAMSEAGITDPYVRLQAPPKAASRWRVHPSIRDKVKPPPSDSSAPRREQPRVSLICISSVAAQSRSVFDVGHDPSLDVSF
jgi:hypothetical protein